MSVFSNNGKNADATHLFEIATFSQYFGFLQNNIKMHKKLTFGLQIQCDDKAQLKFT